MSESIDHLSTDDIYYRSYALRKYPRDWPARMMAMRKTYGDPWSTAVHILTQATFQPQGDSVRVHYAPRMDKDMLAIMEDNGWLALLRWEEQETLRLLSDGETQEQIAERLGVTQGMVSLYKSRAYERIRNYQACRPDATVTAAWDELLKDKPHYKVLKRAVDIGIQSKAAKEYGCAQCRIANQLRTLVQRSESMRAKDYERVLGQYLKNYRWWKAANQSLTHWTRKLPLK